MPDSEPVVAVKVSPISGTAPPVEHRFKPGNGGGGGGWVREQTAFRKALRAAMRVRGGTRGEKGLERLATATFARALAEAESEPGSRAPVLLAILDRVAPLGSELRQSLSSHLQATQVTLNLSGHDVTTGAHCPTCTCPRHEPPDGNAACPAQAPVS